MTTMRHHARRNNSGIEKTRSVGLMSRLTKYTSAGGFGCEVNGAEGLTWKESSLVTLGAKMQCVKVKVHYKAIMDGVRRTTNERMRNKCV
jgi:hypothetical protein